MTNSEKPLSVEDENRALYLAQATERPPAHMDDEILALAQQQALINGKSQQVGSKEEVLSIHPKKGEQKQEQSANWKRFAWPLSSAASVLLVVGVLLINQQWYPVNLDEGLPTVAPHQEAYDVSNAADNLPQQVYKQSAESNREASELLQNSGNEAMTPRAMGIANSTTHTQEIQMQATKKLKTVNAEGAERRAITAPSAMNVQPKRATQETSDMLSESKSEFESEVSQNKLANVSVGQAPLAQVLADETLVNQGNELARQLARKEPKLSELITMLDTALEEKRVADALVINAHLIRTFPELSRETEVSQELRAELLELRKRLALQEQEQQVAPKDEAVRYEQ